MAISRETPKCRFCGKDIAKMITEDYSNTPQSMIPIGDPFIRWDYFQCDCDESKKVKMECKNWNEMTIDQMVDHLKNKYRFLSSEDAKYIMTLIEFYEKHKNK